MLAMAVLTFSCLFAEAQGAAPAGTETILKTEHFDREPWWEGHQNQVAPGKLPTVLQEFGYEPAKPGERKGRIGGVVTRSSRPNYYADAIPPKSLDDKLSASGTFKLAASDGSSGIFFGWFNARQPGGGGRPVSSLGLDLDAEGSGGRLAVRLISAKNRSCGTFITPFVPHEFRPTPIRSDGTAYKWRLAYAPQANQGKGQFTFWIQSDRSPPEAFEGKEFSVDLPDGFKEEGAIFDRFGLMNLMKAGGPLTIFFSDLEHDGKVEGLSRDPGWLGSGNRDRYQDPDQVGAHNFGYSETQLAGGSPGELGGKFWRSPNYGYYADRIGRLSLGQRLEAGGKVVLLVGGPDSDMFFGWFNSASRNKAPAEDANFLGVHVGGPTRVGHYFQPAYRTRAGQGAAAKAGPILVPQKIYDWTLLYDPDANDGRGAIRVTLGNEAVTLDLRNGDKAADAILDRFGLFTSTAGGQMVRIYFDDLKYTVSKSK